MKNRRLTRGIIFATIFIACLLGRSFPDLAPWPMRLSPFLGFATNIGCDFLAVALVCVFMRRFVCRFLCPMGICFEGVGAIRKTVTKTKPQQKFLKHIPKFGLVLALLSWFGCAVGGVTLLCLDPFVVFVSIFRAAKLGIIVFVILLVLSWFSPGLWCRSFCPLGGVQDMLGFPKRLFQRRKDSIPQPSRRRLLQWGTTGTFAMLVVTFLHRKTREIAQRVSLRPPGALEESRFLALCARCGNCVQICPTKLLKPMGNENSLLQWGTPEVVFAPPDRWCQSDCTACSRACPTGAIEPFCVEQKTEHKIGLAVVTFEYCRLYDDVECSVCARNCPFEAIEYVWSDEEYRRIPVVDPMLCNGCGRCLALCPVERQSGKDRLEFPLHIIRAESLITVSIPNGTSHGT